MRHNKKINHLGRTTSHREAMLSNMAASLIKHKRIFTTTAKAKALRVYIEPLITKSKPANKSGEEALHDRRVVFAQLQDKSAVTELFGKVAEKIGDRPGGYTRIVKTGARLGDNASMCFIELVDFNENMLKDSKKAAAKTRRSRRKSSVAATEATPTTPTTPAPKAKATAKKVAEPKVAAPVVEEQEAEVISTVEAPDDTIETAETQEIVDTPASDEEEEK
jgi:large subunit ribosomal protein L17